MRKAIGIESRPFQGRAAINQAVRSECLQAFCIDQEHEYGPWLVERYVTGDNGTNRDEVVDVAVSEIVDDMAEMSSSMFSDVVLYHQGQVIAIVQYACGTGVITKLDLRAHY